MPVCGSCGTENPDVAKFCLACGTPLAAAPPPQEFRKVVTIVFSDLKGSTAMGEKLDSESLREVMTRYFDAMRAELERHGGVIEKFIGDAIMAVFGLPKLHEDDALRAVRAAAGMNRAQAELNEELERHWGVRLTVRTGVNTGQVVAGDPTTGQRLVTGDAVNVAARLEQAAGAQEILLGDLTYRLVRDYVDVEPVEPLELKGKSERVPAYRLLGVREHAERPRRVDAPMVGRKRELELLMTTFDEAVRESRCRLVTVIGDAGVGKSRLVDELLRALEARATVLRGRCLPYGEGITFWPLAEIVREAAGILERDPMEDAQTKLAGIARDRDALDRVASAIGLSSESFPVQELHWGTRKVLEELARVKPLVVVFDDIHWAEATFLELIEHLVDTAEAPLLIVCPARGELLEGRPEWSTGPGSARAELEPLSEEEAGAIADHLLGSAGLDENIRSRVLASAEGNPLYVEQLLSMLVDEGFVRFEDGRWRAAGDIDSVSVPPTIHALLASRLDGLLPAERGVIEPAAVIGQSFVQPALEHLVEEGSRERVPERLATLADKHLVRPDASRPAEENAYRFHHILIRDTTYDGILKRTRATLHERFVEWADGVNREGATEYEEILGYHLERAYRYLSELGPLSEHGRALGLDAATRLASAGKKAFRRGDMPAAASLLQRAAELLPEDDIRSLELMPSLGEALAETGRFEEASVLLGLAVERAHVLNETRLWADALVTWNLMRRSIAEDLDAWMTLAVRELNEVIPALEQISAHAELAKAQRLLGHVHGSVLRWVEQAEAHEAAIEHARLAGDNRLEERLAAEYAACVRDGPTPVPEAVRACEVALERGLGDRQARAFVFCSLARLRAMDGEVNEARELIRRAERLRDELGPNVIVPLTSLQGSRVEWLAGDPAAAERSLRKDFDKLSAMGDRYVLPLVGALLARAVLDQGRLDEAAALHASADAMADESDVETQAILQSVHALLLVERSDLLRAEAAARAAVESLDGVDSLDLRGDCFVILARVFDAAGRHDDARGALGRALELYTTKGNRVSAERTAALLAAGATRSELPA